MLRSTASARTRLDVRRLEPELMDDPALDEADHRRALQALSRVHRLSGTGVRLRRVLDAIAADAIAARRPSDRPLRVLDVACGGGDAALDVAEWGRRRGREIRVTGLDLSPTALAVAQERATRRGLEVEWRCGDALRELPNGPFDLIHSSLFLHHLHESEVGLLLAEMASRANRIHVEDLRRSPLGLALAWTTLRLVSRSRVAHVDGPRSVRAAWSRGELEEIASAAGLSGMQIRRGWPERWILGWARR